MIGSYPVRFFEHSKHFWGRNLCMRAEPLTKSGPVLLHRSKRHYIPVFSFLFQSSLYQSASSHTGELAPFFTVNSSTTDTPEDTPADITLYGKAMRSTIFDKAPTIVQARERATTFVTTSQAAHTKSHRKRVFHPSFRLAVRVCNLVAPRSGRSATMLDFMAHMRAGPSTSHYTKSRIGFFCKQLRCSRMNIASGKIPGLQVVTSGNAACTRGAGGSAPGIIGTTATSMLSQLCIRW